MDLSVSQLKKLYYQKGLSASEVAEKTGTSVWQVIQFMKKNGLQRRKPEESNNLRFLRQMPSFILKRTLTTREEILKAAASMLYWAEGVKTGNTVDFPNSDPKMILFFLKFLRKICQIDENKLRVLLYCYANQRVNDLVEHWSKITKISKEQFYKPYIRNDFSPNGRRMPYGLVHIRYNDKKLLWKLNEWVKEYAKL